MRKHLHSLLVLPLLLAPLLSGCKKPEQEAKPPASITLTRLPTRHDPTALERSFRRPQITAQTLLSTSPVPPGQTDLAGEPLVSSTNGWGPAEVNRSNGEKALGDGKALTLNGQTYPKGFGVHAGSSLTLDLAGQCSTITASVGVDDEVGDRGSVVFQVFLDGLKVWDSGAMTGASATKALSVNAAGAKELRLVVTDAGDGVNYDHADWVNPVCVTVFSPPLVITRGGTYRGNWASDDPTKSAVTVKTYEPVVIENSTLRSRGFLISGWGVDLTVRNVKGEVLLPNVAGWSKGRAVGVEEIRNLLVENSSFRGGGIYVRKFLGSASQGQSIRIQKNTFSDIDGRQSDGQGGLNGRTSFAQAVQFNDVTKIAGAEIAWNQVVNTPGQSAVEDNLNFFASSGTPESPILIHDNYIQGAYPANLSGGFSGGGIMLGDAKVTDPASNGYQRAYDNQVVSTTNYGLAIAGGTGNQLLRNRAVSSGRLPDGTRISAQNVGMYVWDIYGAGGLTPPTFGGHRAEGNTLGWTKVDTGGGTSMNNWWLPNIGMNGGAASGNVWLKAATSDDEKAEWDRWQQKLSAAGVVIGAK